MNVFPQITVITVCYNAEASIEKTIGTVLNQNYPNIEYIIVDGASTDKTQDILRAYEGKISKIVSQADRGIYDAMNKGINLASSEYILFLNADDYFLNESAIENAMRHVQLDKRDCIFYGDIVSVDQETGAGSIWSPKKDVSAHFLFKGSLPHPSTIYKASLFQLLGHYDDSFRISADYEFYVRAFVNGVHIKHIPVLMTVFSTNGISSDNNYKELLKRENERVRLTHFSLAKRLALRLRVRIKKLFNI